jgi:hypothetical protein
MKTDIQNESSAEQDSIQRNKLSHVDPDTILLMSWILVKID